MKECRKCGFIPEITISFDSNITRTGKTTIAKALSYALRDCGYDVSFKFRYNKDIIAETEKRRELAYNSYEIRGFEELKKNSEPRANIVIIPE